jgi:antirestriction protein
MLTETKSKSGTDSPSIYVACLASYNSGHLHGRWIDLTNGEDAMDTDISEMLETSPAPGAEEYAVHDFEGFGPYRVSEWSNVSTLVEIAEAVEEFGPFILAYLAEVHDDLGDAIAAVEEMTEADNFADYVSDYVVTRILAEVDPGSPLALYFDCDKFERDSACEHTILANPDGGVFIMHG